MPNVPGPAKLKLKSIHMVGQHAGPTGTRWSTFTTGMMQAGHKLEPEMKSRDTSIGYGHTVK